MNYIPNYTGFKTINEKSNFILGPSPKGDPDKEYNKPFFIESKKSKDLNRKIKAIPNLKVTWLDGKFGDVAKIEGGTNASLQKLLDNLDNKKDGIQSMGWIDLEESVNEESVNEGKGGIKHAVQQALKQAGYNLKQSQFKVGIKKDSPGYKVSLNGAFLGFDDNMEPMIAKFKEYIEKDPAKYNLKESVNEAAPKMISDPDLEVIDDMIARIGALGRKHPKAYRLTRSAIKSIEAVRHQIHTK